MTLLFLLIPPLLGAVILFFASKGKINWKELLVQGSVALVLMCSGFFLGRCGAMSDTEIWNGRIAEKHKGTESCCHSYPCNCREECSGSGKNKSCSQVCDTCYEHIEDVYWSASTTNGEHVYRNGCNPPGTSEPGRWTAIKVGEPTAVEHRFKNYIKAAPGTILRRQGLAEKFKGQLPDYPRVYDLYRADRMVSAFDVDPSWNAALSEANAVLGHRKQVNIIFVITASGDRGFLHALEEKWLGGKKNDVVVVVGAPEYPKVAWAGVMSWTKAEAMKLAIRDDIEEMGTFDGIKAVGIAQKHVDEGFVRRQMAEFDYLAASIDPPFWLLVVLFVMGMAASGGLGYWFWKEDPFER